MTSDDETRATALDRRRGPSGSLRAGDVVADRYRLAEVIGEGASGVVYLARTLADDQPVALKVIHRELCGDRQIFGRYQREATILRRLHGPHIVAIRDFIEHDGLLVIALDYVDGSSLEEALASPLSIDQAIEVACQIASGLETAHAAGVIHRDLKPANIMIEPRGFSSSSSVVPRVRVLDFGLAKVLHGDQMTTGLTEHDMIFGTPEYMAPEQARGDELDPRCDVYATGVMIYEMATGRVPFSRRTPLATMTAQLTEPVEPPRVVAPTRDIPTTLEAVILRALEKDRDRRFPSARALREALLAVRERRVVSVHPGGDAPSAGADIELGETDLAIRLSQVVPERRAEMDSRAPRSTPSSPKIASARPTEALPVASSPAGGWTVVAVLVALVAIGLGALLALR